MNIENGLSSSTETKSTARYNTDFKKDKELYGTIGEQWFYNKLINSPKISKIIDTTDIKELRKYDVDLIQLKNEATTIEDILSYYENNSYLPENIGVAYEVKTDTQITRTGNIYFEMMSNTNPGCLLRTLSNFVVYCGVNNKNVVVDAYLIKSKEMKLWMLKNWGKINQPNSPMRSFSMDHGKDKTAGILIKIQSLLDNKIATKIAIT